MNTFTLLHSSQVGTLPLSQTRAVPLNIDDLPSIVQSLVTTTWLFLVLPKCERTRFVFGALPIPLGITLSRLIHVAMGQLLIPSHCRVVSCYVHTPCLTYLFIC